MRNICGLLGIFVCFAASAFAGDVGKNPIVPPPGGPFDRGTLEFEAGAGMFGSLSLSAAKRPTINYQLDDLRVGLMYDSPRHTGFFRGNNEFVIEVFGAPVTKGPGSYLTGGSLLWRYNFVQPGARLVPYVQLGAGMLDNDVYRGHNQREIGEAFEFVLQGDLGLKYLINDRWAVAAEADFRHISNADFAPRNQGLNSIGGLLQVSRFFY